MEGAAKARVGAQLVVLGAAVEDAAPRPASANGAMASRSGSRRSATNSRSPAASAVLNSADEIPVGRHDALVQAVFVLQEAAGGLVVADRLLRALDALVGQDRLDQRQRDRRRLLPAEIGDRDADLCGPLPATRRRQSGKAPATDSRAAMTSMRAFPVVLFRRRAGSIAWRQAIGKDLWWHKRLAYADRDRRVGLTWPRAGDSLCGRQPQGTRHGRARPARLPAQAATALRDVPHPIRRRDADAAMRVAVADPGGAMGRRPSRPGWSSKISCEMPEA